MNLIWFRNDLRVQANPALIAASEQGKPCLAIVCLTPDSWSEQGESSWRMALWRDRLRVLVIELQSLNIPLKVLNVGHFSDTASRLLSFSLERSIETIFYNREYPLNECRRDAAVDKMLQSVGVRIAAYQGDLIIPAGEVRTGQDGPFKVYTPFSRAWKRKLDTFDLAIRPLTVWLPESGESSDTIPDDLDWKELPYIDHLWPAKTHAIRDQVYEFIEERESAYAVYRDYPAREGTTKLSPYISICAISSQQLMHVQRAH